MRLFLAVEVPPSPRFAEVTRELVAASPNARPVPAGTWHATLRFLGDAGDPDAVAGAVAPVVARHHSMAAAVRGVGAFPSPRKARVVWAGIDAPGLDALVAESVAATPLDRDPDAKRPFHAHATLARLDPPWDAREFVQPRAQMPFSVGAITEVVLFSSDLTPKGPVYRRVATFPLAP